MGRTHNFLTSTPEEAQRWFTALKCGALVVLQNFSADFSLGPLIGQGHFAAVHIAINSATGAQFAVKSLTKSKLALKDSALVPRSHLMI